MTRAEMKRAAQAVAWWAEHPKRLASSAAKLFDVDAREIDVEDPRVFWIEYTYNSGLSDQLHIESSLLMSEAHAVAWLVDGEEVK